jgi:hypothetical protein
MDKAADKYPYRQETPLVDKTIRLLRLQRGKNYEDDLVGNLVLYDLRKKVLVPEHRYEDATNPIPKT